jgi:hypothetical protein
MAMTSRGLGVLSRIRGPRNLIRRAAMLTLLAAMLPLLFTSCETQGTVYVSHPSVFTRERLVKERLREEQFYTAQLDRSWDSLQTINGLVDQRIKTSVALQLAAGNNGAAPAVSTPAAPDFPGGSATLPNPNDIVSSKAQLTPIDQLKNVSAYREAVYAELRTKQLDDMHDANGATIRDLTFDITIAPGTNTHRAALVVMEIDKAECADQNSECLDDDDLNPFFDRFLARLNSDMNHRVELLLGANERVSIPRAAIARLARQLAAIPPETLEKAFGEGTTSDVADHSPEAFIEFLRSWSEGRNRNCPRSAEFFESSASEQILESSRQVEHSKDRDALRASATRLFGPELPKMPKPDNKKHKTPDANGIRSDAVVPDEETQATLDPLDRMVEFVVRLGVFADESAALTANDWLRIAPPEISVINGRLRVKTGSIEATPTGLTNFNAAIARSESAEHYYAVDVRPKESAQNLSDVLAKENVLSLAIQGAFTAGTYNLGAVIQAMRDAETRVHAIERKPLVVGFGNQSRYFGWLIGPKFEIDGTNPGFSHEAATYSVAVSIVVPATSKSVQIRAGLAWVKTNGCLETSDGGDGDSLQKIARSGSLWNAPAGAIEPAPASDRGKADQTSRGSTLVHLPIDEESLYSFFHFGPRGVPVPEILGVEGNVTAGQPNQTLFITGRELWRNPQVLLDGVPATSVDLLSDMRGLVARFDRMALPPSHASGGKDATLSVVTAGGEANAASSVHIEASPKPAVFVTKVVTKALTPKETALELEYDDRLFPKAYHGMTLTLRPVGKADWAFIPQLPLIKRSGASVTMQFKTDGLKKADTWGSDDAFLLEVGMQVQSDPFADPARMELPSSSLTVLWFPTDESTQVVVNKSNITYDLVAGTLKDDKNNVDTAPLVCKFKSPLAVALYPDIKNAKSVELHFTKDGSDVGVVSVSPVDPTKGIDLTKGVEITVTNLLKLLADLKDKKLLSTPGDTPLGLELKSDNGVKIACATKIVVHTK